MFKRIIFTFIILMGALSAKNVLAAQTYTEKITPNRLTIQREDGSTATISAFRIRGYNVAQLRALVQACGGSIDAVEYDEGYRITTKQNNVPFTPIAFSGVTNVKVQFNVTEIMDKSGKYIKPGEPGWVFLTEYNYNWGSVRDVLTAMGYEIKSYSDDAKNARTSVVIGQIMKTAKGMAEFPTPSVYAGTCPVYIYYEDTLKPCVPAGWQLQYFDDPGGAGEKVWIYARDGVKSIRIYRVGYTDNNGTFTFKAEQKLYESSLAPNQALVLNTVIPEGIPFTAVSLAGNDGNTYSYVLGYNGRTGHVNAMKVELGAGA